MKISYSKERRPPIPVLEIKIYSPIKNGYAKIVAYVDTGFDGGILIPFSLYENLGLTLVEEPHLSHGVFPSGSIIKLHTAVTEIEMAGFKMNTHVYSSPFIHRKLVGREVLNNLILLLNGPQRELEIKTDI
ncbi:MAG: hypothetical protein DRJ47_10870 [Thermoprotei archaeon]|nr:MAG: hypothetical protein DRJ47_10870 [Thermoprotei archaeon]